MTKKKWTLFYLTKRLTYFCQLQRASACLASLKFLNSLHGASGFLNGLHIFTSPLLRQFVLQSLKGDAHVETTICNHDLLLERNLNVLLLLASTTGSLQDY
ncbi:MAG: hypothetical protein AM326_05030 [Candidatus Thorarchaeota archaeon SMTZ-45]|nr:MAG: hypothetical protein AM326_05030 [Candidatus Thorarchaeota archaeon SMTZ-45]